MLTIKDLTGPINRLLDKVKPGARLPANINDSNARDMLTMIVDVLVPKGDDGNEFNRPNNGRGAPMLMSAQVSWRRAGRPRTLHREPTKSEIAAAKLELLEERRKLVR